MDLKGLVVLADDQAVADGVEIFPEGLQVGVLLELADHKHCVKGEGDILHIDGLEVSFVRGSVAVLPGLGHGQAPDLVQHALEDDQEALAAGVHHPGLFQHRVLVHGVGQRLLPLLNGGLQHALKGVVLPGVPGGPGGGQTGDGEDGALGGLHDRLIGGGHAEVQGDRQVPAVHGLLLLDGLGEAPEQQGQNHAGVAPCPPEQGGGGAPGGLAYGVVLLLPHLGGGGSDGEGHVGAGVSVGDREHVQVVDRLLLGADGGVSVNHHPLKYRRVDHFYHIRHIPFRE